MKSCLLSVSRIDAVLSALPAAPSSWLSDSEQSRLARLHVGRRRQHYLAGHWLARCLLAKQYGGLAADWQLSERADLPPAVLGHETAIQLSLSHSGDWVAGAVAEQAIGIDIEQRQPARPALLRFQHLLLADGEATDSLSADALLQRWVVKEAWIKRQHGSALPEQLAALHLQPTDIDIDIANVQLLSTEDFHLGVAGDAGNLWEIAAELTASNTTGWRVTL